MKTLGEGELALVVVEEFLIAARYGVGFRV